MNAFRLKWVVVGMGFITALVGAVAATLLRPNTGEARQMALRHAFEAASDVCYRSYDGVELQACLAGAMKAHLQAIGDGRDGATTEAVSATSLPADGPIGGI